MLPKCNRAFKEWDVACRAMMAGEQTILVRKGGIHEVGGQFVIDDSEFWLMPTFDHQSADMLQDNYASRVAESPNDDPGHTAIQGYAVVEQVWLASDDAQVAALNQETIWNERYVKLRFDYDPYSPLYIMLLRVYQLTKPVVLPMIKEYAGCKSWVTLDRSISTSGLMPAISESEFALRKHRIKALLRT